MYVHSNVQPEEVYVHSNVQSEEVYVHSNIQSEEVYVHSNEKPPPKWQKNDLVSVGHGRAAMLGACVNWVDWLRTSADERMWSGRRAVVMVR